jgi:hypothetical protein
VQSALFAGAEPDEWRRPGANWDFLLQLWYALHLNNSIVELAQRKIIDSIEPRNIMQSEYWTCSKTEGSEQRYGIKLFVFSQSCRSATLVCDES